METAAVRKLAELKKETAERAARNPARYEKFSDRIKELIQQFNAGLLDADEILDDTESLARELLAEDEAHKGSGLGELAFGIHAILETFKGPVDFIAQPPATYGDEGGSELTAIQRAALAIDSLYASDETAPPHWQERSQLKKGLRGRVRRLVRDLALEGWARRIPVAVEHYAVLHYRKP
ncbi:MAG: DUF3387 domain-containing protein [bacterium]|nr:DUF3387 domain-containing protein [bacterium]